MTANAAAAEQNDKLVIIIGATGSGKSKLSIDLATLFSGEIINCDKIQVYKGLDITTNKVTMQEQKGIKHHLLDVFDSNLGEFTTSDFRYTADIIIKDVLSRGKLPVVVGGSNSYIHALLAKEFDPKLNPFDGLMTIETNLRYDCCFIWIDALFSILEELLDKRVHDMLDEGMLEELAEFYSTTRDYRALAKAIGVPEFDKYFKILDKETRPLVLQDAYEDAIREMKRNTGVLAKKQIQKIKMFDRAGWNLNRVDTTAAIRAILVGDNAEKMAKAWEQDVINPSINIVNKFLQE